MSNSPQATTAVSVFEIFNNIRRALPSQQRTNPYKKQYGAIAIALAIILVLYISTAIRVESELQADCQIINFLVNSVQGLILSVIIIPLFMSIYFWFPSTCWSKLVDRFNSCKWILKTVGYFIALVFFAVAWILALYLPLQTAQEETAQEDFKWWILILSAILLVPGIVFRYFLRKEKEVIFSGSLRRSGVLFSETTRIAGDMVFLLASIAILVALIFGLSHGQEDSSWQTAVSMISGAVLGLLLGWFREGFGVRKKLQETLSQGCGHLRDIELTARLYRENNADFTSRDALEIIRSIERYLEWVGTFLHGKNEALVITVDWQTTELWLLMRNGITGEPCPEQLRKSYESEISDLWALRDQPGTLAIRSGEFARELRERLEESRLLDS